MVRQALTQLCSIVTKFGLGKSPAGSWGQIKSALPRLSLQLPKELWVQLEGSHPTIHSFTLLGPKLPPDPGWGRPLHPPQRPPLSHGSLPPRLVLLPAAETADLAERLPEQHVHCLPPAVPGLGGL